MSEISICSYICDLQLNNPYKKKKTKHQNTKIHKSNGIEWLINVVNVGY